MTKTEWQAKVTKLVNAQVGPNFNWDEVSEGEWEELWQKGYTFMQTADRLMGPPRPPAAMARIEIIKKQQGEQVLCHWSILTDQGDEFAHSGYHTDRTKCEAEATERLEQARREGLIEDSVRTSAVCPYCQQVNSNVESGVAHRCRECGERFYAGE